MCLDKGWKKLKKGDKKEGVGYKMFWHWSDGTISSQCQRSGDYKKGVWCNERDYRPGVLSGPDYGYGFHVFKSRKGVEVWRGLCYKLRHPPSPVYKVNYRNATVTGKDHGYKCIVAKEIYIYPEKLDK